jgi:hypothetical protein
LTTLPACVSGLVNWNEVYFDMADRLATLVHDSSMDAAKTVKTVYGTFVIVRRWIQRFIPTMYHKYVERNGRDANHKPIFLAILYRLRNSVLKETHRRNQTSTSEDQTPQNWPYSSEKGRHTERRGVTTIFHPPVKFTEAGSSSDIMIQLRNVPDALHRGLKARAAMAGMSLSEYLLAEIKEIAERPTLAELRERLHTRKPVSAQIDTAQLVREEREAR